MSASFMATAIGFQFSTAKVIIQNVYLFHRFFIFFDKIFFHFWLQVIKEDQYPTIIDSDHCFHPNKKLFGILVGLGCGLVTAIIFHFILLKPLLNAKKEFKLSLSFITKKFKKDDEQIGEIPDCHISKNLEITNTKIGTINGNGHANGHVKDYHIR